MLIELRAFRGNGHLLNPEVPFAPVDVQGLSAWSVSGPDIDRLADALRHQPGVDLVTPFGNTLHVVGHDADALRASVQGLASAGVHCEPIAAGLEDVFIRLMSSMEDDYA